MPKVSVIISARNAAATLGRTLASLANQEFDDAFEVVLVDDGSTDATPELAARAAGDVKLLKLTGLGAAGARNSGAGAASGDLLAFTDADCFATTGWLAAGALAANEADLVQGAVLPEAGTPIGPFDRSLWVTRDTGLHETANLFVRRELFERLGGFVDLLPSTGGRPMGEDAWLGWRARRAGATYVFCPQAVVHHAVFRRSARQYIAENERRVHFPAIVARIPELRESFLFGRSFLNRRTAAFDAALAAAGLAVIARSRLPLLGGLPYAWMAATHAHRAGRRRRPCVAAADVAADAVTFAALVRGSATSRSLVI